MNNNIIGTSRTIVIGVLIAINALVFLSKTYYLDEQKRQATRSLSGIQSETRQMQTETRQIVERSEELLRKSVAFEELRQEGILNDQNRVTVRDSFNMMAGVTELIDASYSVSPAEPVENDMLERAGYKLLQSNVEVEMAAINDVKMYNFLYLIANKYPGIVNIKTVEVSKTAEVTANALRAMNSDNPRPLVEGFVSFDWISVAPLDSGDGG